MKVLRVIVVIAAAIIVQTTLAVLLGPRAAGLDLVLVAVVYLALVSGPRAGLLAGAIAGLIQDAMGSGIIGIGGLGKTVVGFLAGYLGAQFIVARPMPRFVVFFAATLVDAVVVMSLLWVLSMRQSGAALLDTFERAIGHALVGVVLFQLIETGPRIAERWRLNRARSRAVRLK